MRVVRGSLPSENSQFKRERADCQKNRSYGGGLREAGHLRWGDSPWEDKTTGSGKRGRHRMFARNGAGMGFTSTDRNGVFKG